MNKELKTKIKKAMIPLIELGREYPDAYITFVTTSSDLYWATVDNMEDAEHLEGVEFFSDKMTIEQWLEEG